MIFNIDKFFHKEKLNRALNSKNVIPMNGIVYDDENTGLKYYLNNDGSLFLNGTANRDTNITFCYDSQSAGLHYFEVGKTYKIVCNGESDKVTCKIVMNGNTFNYHAGDTFTATDNHTVINFYYSANAGDTFDNFTFYPMICLSSYTGDWVSYSANNGILTKAVNKLKDTVGSDSLNTTAKTLTGAVNELDSDISSINSDVSSILSKFVLDSAYFENMKITNGYPAGRYLSITFDVKASGRTGALSGVKTVGLNFTTSGLQLETLNTSGQWSTKWTK